MNTSPNATQGSAIESNFAPGNYGWADISARSTKAERTTDGKLDLASVLDHRYLRTDWEDFEYGNVAYTSKLTATDNIVTNNTYGGHHRQSTNLRTDSIAPLLQAYTMESTCVWRGYPTCCSVLPNVKTKSTGHPTHNRAIDWINEVRNRADLPDLELKADSADKPSSRLPTWSVRKNLL